MTRLLACIFSSLLCLVWAAHGAGKPNNVFLIAAAQGKLTPEQALLIRALQPVEMLNGHALATTPFPPRNFGRKK